MMSSQIPLPMPDSDSREYWEGVARGELRIQRCDACQRSIFYPRSLCPHCFAEQLSWVTATGKGTIYAYTVVHQAFGPFAENVPFVIGIVELEEGVRMLTRIVGQGQITVGAAVHVIFEVVNEQLTLPYFQLL